MCEVTLKNFNEILPELENLLKSAKLIAIDTEFSCLTASSNLENSLFDSAQDRYSKLRTTVQQIIPFQFGLTAYTFDPDSNTYKGHPYTFYTFPRTSVIANIAFVSQAASFQFLSLHNFDFNKLVYEGIPYLNRVQEEEVAREADSFCIGSNSESMVLEDLLDECCQSVENWLNNDKDTEELILKYLESFKYNYDLKYFCHRELRSRFRGLWTFEDDEGFKVQRVSEEKCLELIKNDKLHGELLSNLLGFTRVFRLLVLSKKPIIGHNLFFDLMLLIHHFETPLPKSYLLFKRTVHSLFPKIFDTKYITFEVYRNILNDKQKLKTGLASVYLYFKDGPGRHLAPQSPFIQLQGCNSGTFHNAGWDSFCTGYIFIRLAHVCAAQKSQVRRKLFMCNELLQAVSQFENRVYIARGHLSFIQLDGEDPESRRPPRLIVQGLTRRPVDINKVTSLLSSCGFVEVKPYSSNGQRAIVAVDNFGSARRILRKFQSHPDFVIQQYSFLRHSPVASAFFWSGLILSGSFLGWYGYLKTR
ncbi:hypothetical protein PPYR_06614 [Photinus pyralis]|uniref:Uncharacterized protein n=1 Tax=Photinus pyralis TaxID=7054 RepID=A0A1Y1MLM5_PHOPY|nr:pre-piRNA 3'-exonuclease trimmer-like [Photinus pyralis]KAB0798734.1 hypothetical protein PPYR_06614 [Photinus pyralis]